MAGVLFGVFPLFFFFKVRDKAARELNVVKQESEVEGGERKKAECPLSLAPPPSFSRFKLTVSRGLNVWRVRRRNKVTVSRGLTIQV